MPKIFVSRSSQEHLLSIQEAKEDEGCKKVEQAATENSPPRKLASHHERQEDIVEMLSPTQKQSKIVPISPSKQMLETS